MKISISATELYAMPDVAWIKLITFLTDSAAEYTLIQKTAAMCLLYHSRMYDDEDRDDEDFFEEEEKETMDAEGRRNGHRDFLDYCEENDIDAGGVIQALADVGAREFAENLAGAVNDAQQDNRVKADEWFYANAISLMDRIEAYWRSNFDAFYTIVDEDYTMRQPKYAIQAGIFGAAFFLVLVIVFEVWAYFAGDLTALVALAIFLVFAPIIIPCLVIAVQAKLWSVSVKKDRITTRFPLWKNQAIPIDDISAVRQKQKKIIVYAHGKRFLTVNRAVSEFRMFREQLRLAGKYTDVLAQDLTLRQSKANIATGLTGVISGALAATGSLMQEKPVFVPEILFYMGIMLCGACLTAYYLRWRVTVSGEVITVKKMLREAKEYPMSDVTKVKSDNHHMILYAREKKIVKIPRASEGSSVLAGKLAKEGILFNTD